MRLDDDTRLRISRARAVLEGEDDAASIADVARRAGISPYHFIRVFEAAFGVTPHRYRTGARLERARRLLAGGASVTRVCMELGFSSVGSFSAMFARHLGESPSRYQRRVRAGAFRNFREA
ncbi:MAG: helix-turn-helix transcriptional regulator [Labilithrix sp.]|nr:helix-turn-helix transcriptional regulator [Labilithrix sp.]MCW5810196.1 helix-turn-helix transcriptional regulator [Labilithrix sp.]